MTRPAPLVPPPIASLFPSGRLPTHDRARVHARQRFFHPEPDNPFDRPYRLLRIAHPSPAADTADPIDRYIRDFHDRVPF